MTMITIFAKPQTKDYFAKACSFTFFTYIILVVFAIIFPFLAAWASDNFWIRESTLHDTPIFLYNNELQLYLLKGNTSYFYTTITELNDIHPRKIPTPSVRYVTHDKNLDSLIERLDLTITVPRSFIQDYMGNEDNNAIQAMKLGVFFDYGYNSKVKLMFKSMLMIDLFTYNGLKGIKVIGDLQFNQKSAVVMGSMSKNLYYKDLIRKTISYSSSNIKKPNANPFDLTGIYSDFKDNNFTTSFSYDYFDKHLIPDDSEITIEVQVNIPYQEQIIIIPTYLTTFKDAWIQYFSLLLPIAFGLRLGFYYLVSSGVFRAFNFDDSSLQKKKMA